MGKREWRISDVNEMDGRIGLGEGYFVPKHTVHERVCCISSCISVSVHADVIDLRLDSHPSERKWVEEHLKMQHSQSGLQAVNRDDFLRLRDHVVFLLPPPPNRTLHHADLTCGLQ